MKNKDKYKLTDLKFQLTTTKNNEFRQPIRFWKIYVYKDDVAIESIKVKGGGLSDVMAWLESEVK